MQPHLFTVCSNHIVLLSVFQFYHDWSTHGPLCILFLCSECSLPGVWLANTSPSFRFQLILHVLRGASLPSPDCLSHGCVLLTALCGSACIAPITFCIWVSLVLLFEDGGSFCPPAVLRALVYPLPSPGDSHVIHSVLGVY